MLTNGEWSTGAEITTYTARIGERDRVAVGMSTLLVALERETLRVPETGGRWRLSLDEVRPPPLPM